MLKVNIICIGKIKEKYFSDAVSEYAKRLGAFCKFAVVELPEERIKSNTPNAAQIDEVLTAEGRRILQKIATEQGGQAARRPAAFHEPHDLSAPDGADDFERTDLPRV